MRLRRLDLVVLAALVTVAAPSRTALAATPQPYTTKLVPTGQADLDAALRASSSLIALQKTRKVGPFALAGRIRSDYGRLQTALQSFGYYDGAVTITAAGHSGQDPQLANVLAAFPAGKPAPVTLSFARGPLFTLGRVQISDPGETLSPQLESALGLQSGQPAIASEVLAAQGRLLGALRDSGHAFADVKTPLAYLRPASRTLDIVYDLHQGPVVHIGRIELVGLKRVNPSFIRRRLLEHTGELYQPGTIEAARQDLASIGVFSSVQARIGDKPDADGTVPLIFTFTEARLHTVAANVGYSTDLGGSAGLTWTHHDLFGNAEELQLAAIATGLGGTSQQGLGYDVYANLSKPDFLRRDQTLVLRLEGLKQDLIAYNQTALLARAAINRRLSKQWTVSAGLGAEQEQIIQEGVTSDYTLGSIPISAAFDSTDLSNPLDPATHGVRVGLSATPTYSVQKGGAFFTILQVTGSTYFDLARIGLTAPGRSVIALRALVGSVQGASTFQLPPDQRFYGGGSATIRGFKYQGVGPLFPDGNPVGGTSIDAATIEFRQRLFKSWGFATFVDAGQVASRSAPFEGTLRIGAGAGVRYFTPIGPIRVDFAVPLNKPPGGDSFELYVGLGETF